MHAIGEVDAPAGGREKTFVKVIGRILIALVLVGLFVLLLHAAYRYVLPQWVAILFYLYAAFVLLVMGSGVRAAMDAGKAEGLREVALIAAEKAGRTDDWKGRIGRVRDWAGSVSQLIAESLVWPVSSFFGFKMGLQSGGRKVPLREIAARLQTKCYEHFLSLFTLAVVGLIYFLLRSGVSLGRYGTIFLTGMLVAVAARLFSYVVGRNPLAARLRRSSTSPYLAFLVIIAADFVSLVATLTILGRVSGVQTLGFPDFKSTAEAVYKAQEPIDILRGMTLNFHQIVTGIAGLLFYGALFKIVLEFGEFKRRDEDYVWLASTANELGQFSAAVKYLEKVEKWDQPAHAIKMIALVGVNDLDAAEREAGMLSQANSAAPQNEWIFLNLTDGCLLARAPTSVVAAVLKRGVESGVRDVISQGSISQFAADETSANEFLKVIAGAKEHYRMTGGVLEFLAGHGPEAASEIESVHYDDAISEFVRLVLLLRIKVGDNSTKPEEDSVAFHDWVATKLPEVKLLAKSLKEPFDCSIALTSLMGVVVYARYMAPETVEEVTYLCDALKVKAASQVTLLKFVEARFEHITKGLPQPAG